MTHFYTTKKWNANAFKIVCKNEYVSPRQTDFWAGHPKEFTTTRSKVTCHECLAKLIPKVQAELDTMNRTYALNSAAVHVDVTV